MADDKHLLLTIAHRGIDIINRIERFPKEDPVDSDPGGRASQDIWQGDKWHQYKAYPGSFSVKENQKIIIYKDDTTYLKHYEFARFERPFGLRYPHWTDEPISIDNPRRTKGEFTDEAYCQSASPGTNKFESKDMFVQESFEPDTLSFTYIGPSVAKESTHPYFFAFDLYLKKIGSVGYPNEGEYIWHGPVIRNDGGSNP